MKTIFTILILAVCAFGQQYNNVIDFGQLHGYALTKTIQVTSGSASVKDVDSVYVQFTGRYNVPVIDTLANEATITAGGFTAGRTPIWGGTLEIDFYIDNTDLATDSLQVKVYALDLDGNVVYNDYCWASFATPPAYVTAANVLSWTTLRRYRASLTGAFGKGTGGLLILIDANDATDAHYGVMYLRVWI